MDSGLCRSFRGPRNPSGRWSTARSLSCRKTKAAINLFLTTRRVYVGSPVKTEEPVAYTNPASDRVADEPQAESGDPDGIMGD
jgi:hypothetical protein